RTKRGSKRSTKPTCSATARNRRNSMENEFVTDNRISVMAQLPDQAVASMLMTPPYPNYQGLFSDQISDGYPALYLACRKVKKYIVFFWHPRAPAPVPPRGWYEVARHIWHKP